MSKTINRDELLLKRSDGLAEHIFVEALSNALDHDSLEQFMEDIDWKNKKEFECYLVVEGREFPLMAVCEHWENQADRVIAEKAMELLGDKLSDVETLLGDISESILRKASERLGIEFDDERWR